MFSKCSGLKISGADLNQTPTSCLLLPAKGCFSEASVLGTAFPSLTMKSVFISYLHSRLYICKLTFNSIHRIHSTRAGHC